MKTPNEIKKGLECCISDTYGCYEAFIVEAENEAMSAVLSENIYNGVVIAVEADGDLLKVWVKEE